ncbi:hypothetical protein ACS0TY_005202 [Phlomoides rotata]
MENHLQTEKYGGPGDERFESFNRALIGRWMWRFLNEREGPWVKVLESKYGRIRGGESVEEVMRGSGQWSSWWRDVVRNTMEEKGMWFKDRLERVIGDGKNTLFWEDNWVGGEVLRAKFPRLFRLSRDKDGSVGDMGGGRGADGDGCGDEEGF